MLPRAVLVERPTEYAELLARHGTREQARFFLHARDRTLEEVEGRHRALEAARASVLAAIPPEWRRASVLRPELAADLLADVAAGRAALQYRTMAAARLDDGQALLALNEVFVGHASHQSARYALR